MIRPVMPRTKATQPNGRTVGRLRLLSQRLVGGGSSTAVEAVRRSFALQAQDLDSVLWSIGLRAPGLREPDVLQAMTTGAVVRSWPMRGTLHVTAAEDLPWLLATLSARVVAATAARRAALDLDQRALERARDIAIKQLSGGRALTREQLLAAFANGGVAVDAQRGYHILFNLSLTSTLCFGPPSGKEQTFVLLAEWVRKRRRLDRDEALGELARRYFESHGPATIGDLVGWAKLTVAAVKRGVDIAGKALTSIAIDGERYLMGAGGGDALAASEPAADPSVLALPGFDEYVLGYKGRDAVLDPAFADRIVPGGNGVFRPTIVVDGQIEGVWRKKKLAKAIAIEHEPFTRLSKGALRSFAAAAERYGRFLDTAVRLD
jgi:hypothetical protein